MRGNRDPKPRIPKSWCKPYVVDAAVKREARERAEQYRLVPKRLGCPACGKPMRLDTSNERTIATMCGYVDLNIRIARCHTAGCPLELVPYHPEVEGIFARPKKKYGLDVVLAAGAFYYDSWFGYPTPNNVYHELQDRGNKLVSLSSVRTLVKDCRELLGSALDKGTKAILEQQQCVSIAIRYVLGSESKVPRFPKVGLWLVEDTISQTVLDGRYCPDCDESHIVEHSVDLVEMVKRECPVPFADVLFVGNRWVPVTWSAEEFSELKRAESLRGYIQYALANRMFELDIEDRTTAERYSHYSRKMPDQV